MWVHTDFRLKSSIKNMFHIIILIASLSKNWEELQLYLRKIDIYLKFLEFDYSITIVCNIASSITLSIK